MNKFKCTCLIGMILLPLSAWANPDYREQVARFYDIPSTTNLTLLKVKGYQQTEDYTCGPAAVMSLLHYYGKLSDSQMNHATEMKIAKEMGTSTKVGTTQQHIVTWLERQNFKVISGTHGSIDLLRSYLGKGMPIIVEWVDWGGHWVVVTGYNAQGKNIGEDKDTLFLADPVARFDNTKTINGLITINPDRFQSMWFDAQYFDPGHLVRGIYIVAVPPTQLLSQPAD